MYFGTRSLAAVHDKDMAINANDLKLILNKMFQENMKKILENKDTNALKV